MPCQGNNTTQQLHAGRAFNSEIATVTQQYIITLPSNHLLSRSLPRACLYKELIHDHLVLVKKVFGSDKEIISICCMTVK